MIKSINIQFLIFSSLIYLFFLSNVSVELMPIYFVSFITVFVYYGVITKMATWDDESLTEQTLKYVVFIYSIVSVTVFNILSYVYQGNYFVFSERDALGYHIESIRMVSMSFWSGIEYFLGIYSYEDLGIVLVISTIYRLIESNLAFNAFNIIIGVITAVSIFRIGINIMEQRYAFLAALTYSISSFVQWFHASGLKESLMVMFVVLFYGQYYAFNNERKIRHITFMILIAMALLLFRPPLTYFCVISAGLAFFMTKQKGFVGFLFLCVVIVAIAMLSPVWESNYQRFLYSGDMNRVVEVKEAVGMIKGGIDFTYFVNIVAQLVGPLPSVSPDHSKHLSLYAVGGIYRVLLAVPFWFGVYYIAVQRLTILYPLIFFALFEMVSLVVLFEGLELRKSLLHFPSVFIVAFWFLNALDIPDNQKKKDIIGVVLILSSIILSGIIIYWNMRYL